MYFFKFCTHVMLYAIKLNHLSNIYIWTPRYNITELTISLSF